MLRVSGTTTALIFASCRIVNWWLTAGSAEGSFVAGLNMGSPTSGEKSLQYWAGSSVLVGVCRRWRLTNRGLKWIQAVCLTMSGQAIPRLMKWLAAARLGMRWHQVMSTPVERRGTRRLMWPISCPWLLFTSARLESGRPTPKVLKMWRFVMLLLLLVLDSSSRFTKVAWALDRWRCSRCQRYARNNSTLATLRRTACVPLFGASS